LRREVESGQALTAAPAAQTVPDSKDRIRALFATAHTAAAAAPQLKTSKVPWLVAGGVAALATLAAVILLLRPPASPPTVISSLQITSDGTSKRSLVTDGLACIFSEYVSGHSVLMQVSTSGGETAPLPISLASGRCL